MVPELVKVVTPVIVVVVGKVRVPELSKVVIVRIPTDESPAAEIVPALVTVVILEMVAVAGNVKVAPVLLVKVVGLKFNVEPEAKLMVPELPMVPPVAVIEEVDWKLIVLSELLVMPVLVRVVRAGKLRVAVLFVKVVTLVMVAKLSTVMVPLCVKVVMLEMVFRFGAVRVPELVKVVMPEIVVTFDPSIVPALVIVPILEIVVPGIFSVPLLARLVPVVLPRRTVAAVKE